MLNFLTPTITAQIINATRTTPATIVPFPIFPATKIAVEELGECVSGADSVEQEVEKKELVRAINGFLDTLSQEKCNIFLCRYWYALPVSEIATRFGMSEENVSVTLNRIRGKLKNYLIERGYDL